MSDKILFQDELETLRQLAEIVNEQDLGEATIRVGDKELTVKGRKCPPPPPAGGPTPPPPPGGMPPKPDAFAPNASAPTAPASEQVTGNVVKSPIVGTFYAAPSPTDKPFVEVGSKVKKGDVIYIIESMKIMNEVKSDFDGEVLKVLVSSGDSVDFDQPIMIVG